MKEKIGILSSTKMLMPLDIQMFAKFDSKSFNPQAFAHYVNRVPNLKRNELLKSGALRSNADISNMFSNQSGSFYGRIPMFDNIGGTPLNYDGQTDITAQTTTTYEQGVIVVGRAQAWTEKDFSYDVTSGVDFMDNVSVQVAQYWDGVDQDTLLGVLKGIFSMTDTGSLDFVDQHTFDITTATDKKVGATTLNSAIQKAAGDNKAVFTTALMHSQVATNLENLNVLEYLKYTDANGITRNLQIAQWNGRIVLVDDSLPFDEATETYTTFVLGSGAFSYEDVGAKVPHEMHRDPLKFGGQDFLISRQRKVFAPYGISFEKTSVASLSPTAAEIANGANWIVVNDGSGKYFNHRAIPIAQIKSLG